LSCFRSYSRLALVGSSSQLLERSRVSRVIMHKTGVHALTLVLTSMERFVRASIVRELRPVTNCRLTKFQNSPISPGKWYKRRDETPKPESV
jgi:penicillin V acylase-like amidase (Ntn superfamily)